MLTNIFAYNILLRNTLNRPLYLVHSDLDDLRRIQQTRLIVDVLDSINSPVLYKEYIGYKHYDKHLQIDLPYSYEWMKGISRNAFQTNITWELSDTIYNSCDWLHVTQFDTTIEAAPWQKEFQIKLYNSKVKMFVDVPYYMSNKSAAIKAFYNNNIFEINTSRIKEIELLISPVMVNLQNPVIVKVNGKEVFSRRTNIGFLYLSSALAFQSADVRAEGTLNSSPAASPARCRSAKTNFRLQLSKNEWNR